jgi:hypothetical protein
MTASYSRLHDAWAELANGDPESARSTFSHELELWRPLGTGSPGYVDAIRGIMLANLYDVHDVNALRVFHTIVAEMGAEPAGDRFVYAGDVQTALRAYRDATQDQAIADPRPGPDRIVSAGVRLALRGDWFAAIRAWSQPAVGGGPYDLTDLQTALCGLAYAHLKDWRDAEKFWILAAQTGRNVPQTSWMYPGNMMALSLADVKSVRLFAIYSDERCNQRNEGQACKSKPRCTAKGGSMLLKQQ